MVVIEKCFVLFYNITVTTMRARVRILTTAATAGILLGAITGCSPSESKEAALTRYGYTDIVRLSNEGRPNSYEATLNNCRIDLAITQDKEIWVGVIVKTPQGEMRMIPHTPGENAFERADKTDELRKDPRFTKFCP
jgi:hypothetical protein